jgi:hypothetical protein
VSCECGANFLFNSRTGGILLNYKRCALFWTSDIVSLVSQRTRGIGDFLFLNRWSHLSLRDTQREMSIAIQVALILFNSLTETIGDVLRPHFGTLQSVFINGLNDQHSDRVRIAALK